MPAASVAPRQQLAELLSGWAATSLSEDTAPLLASFAWVQQREAADPAEQERWQGILATCEHTGLPLQRPLEASAFDERDDSRAADAALGDGPITVQLQPPRDPSLASSASMPSMPSMPSQGSLAPIDQLQKKPKAKAQKGTFGSSREPSDPAVLQRALRHQLPGPGAYAP